jgi:prevent-host-death family protein
MKVTTLRKARARLSAVIEESNDDRVLITTNGKPAAVVIGVKGQDLEEVLLAANPKFWAMIEESRRSDRTLSAAEIRARIAKRVKTKTASRKRPRATR